MKDGEAKVKEQEIEKVAEKELDKCKQRKRE